MHVAAAYLHSAAVLPDRPDMAHQALSEQYQATLRHGRQQVLHSESWQGAVQSPLCCAGGRQPCKIEVHEVANGQPSVLPGFIVLQRLLQLAACKGCAVHSLHRYPPCHVHSAAAQDPVHQAVKKIRACMTVLPERHTGRSVAQLAQNWSTGSDPHG